MVYVETIAGLQPAVFVRDNKLGKPVIRRLYFTLGNELSLYSVKPIPTKLRGKVQAVADAVKAARDAQGIP